MASKLERLAPRSGRGLAVCAGTFLYGDALIIGAGELCAAQSALSCASIFTLTIIEKDCELYEEAVGRMSSRYQAAFQDKTKWRSQGDKIRLFNLPFLSYDPVERYDSIFFDVFPITGDDYHQAWKCVEWLRTGGRLICIPSVGAKKMGTGWIDEARITPGAPNSGPGFSGLLIRRKLEEWRA